MFFLIVSNSICFIMKVENDRADRVAYDKLDESKTGVDERNAIYDIFVL